MPVRVPVEILPQPDDSTCGPTCLHAVYRSFGDGIPLEEVIREVEPLRSGGTLGVHLGRHALRRGYAATIYTYNLVVFDPTWFAPGVDLVAKLRAQSDAKPDPKLREATRAYLAFLELGGQIVHRELGPALLERLLAQGPVITGLSATYLYDCAREWGDHRLVEDDVRGEAVGHFVVLCEYDRARGQIVVADPLEDRPGFDTHRYLVSSDRVIGAILLGVLTYDANLVVLRPRDGDGSTS